MEIDQEEKRIREMEESIEKDREEGRKAEEKYLATQLIWARFEEYCFSLDDQNLQKQASLVGLSQDLDKAWAFHGFKEWFEKTASEEEKIYARAAEQELKEEKRQAVFSTSFTDLFGQADAKPKSRSLLPGGPIRSAKTAFAKVNIAQGSKKGKEKEKESSSTTHHHVPLSEEVQSGGRMFVGGMATHKGFLRNLRTDEFGRCAGPSEEAATRPRSASASKKEFEKEKEWQISDEEVKRLNLPRFIHVKTKTESYNHEFFVALREGKVYIKRYRFEPKKKGTKEHEEEVKEEEKEEKENSNKELVVAQPCANEALEFKWFALMGDGLPRGPSFPTNPLDSAEFVLKRFNRGWETGKTMTSISVDGDNLVMTDENLRIHYTKFTGWLWQGRWGLNLPKSFDTAPAEWLDLCPHTAYSISHRGPYNFYYSDYFGKHIQDIGVTSLYLLDKKGNILFADPWLPPKWNRPLPGPQRNTLDIANLDATCSTMFVIGRNGEMYTRMCDYDTLGNNIWFEFNEYYNWDKGYKEVLEKKGELPEFNNQRLLPNAGQEWRKHAFPYDKFIGTILTDNITLSQVTLAIKGDTIRVTKSGEGNSARQMKVLAQFDGKVGYFVKEIDDGPEKWEFCQAGKGDQDLNALFEKSAKLPFKDHFYYENLDRNYKSTDIDKKTAGTGLTEVSLYGFNPVEYYCQIEFGIKDKRLSVPLHIRRQVPDERNRTITAWGTIIFPDEVLKGDSPFHQLYARFANPIERFPNAINVYVESEFREDEDEKKKSWFPTYTWGKGWNWGSGDEEKGEMVGVGRDYGKLKGVRVYQEGKGPLKDLNFWKDHVTLSFVEK